MDKEAARMLFHIYYGLTPAHNTRNMGQSFGQYYDDLKHYGDWSYVKLVAKELFEDGYFDTDSGEFECDENVKAFNYKKNLKGYRFLKNNDSWIWKEDEDE